MAMAFVVVYSKNDGPSMIFMWSAEYCNFTTILDDQSRGSIDNSFKFVRYQPYRYCLCPMFTSTGRISSQPSLGKKPPSCWAC